MAVFLKGPVTRPQNYKKNTSGGGVKEKDFGQMATSQSRRGRHKERPLRQLYKDRKRKSEKKKKKSQKGVAGVFTMG